MYSVLLVVDDDIARSATASALEASGFIVSKAKTISDALLNSMSVVFNAAVIDYDLSDGQGMQLYTQLQENKLKQRIPTIVLCPQCNDNSRIKALSGGADDAMSQPVSLNELVLRLNNLLNHRYLASSEQDSKDNAISSNGIRLDLNSFKVTVDGESTDLSLSEFKLLYNFMSNPNKAFSRTELRTLTKGDDETLDERSIDVYVMRLRKSLQKHGYDDLIKTVRGVGYRFNQ